MTNVLLKQEYPKEFVLLVGLFEKLEQDLSIDPWTAMLLQL